MINYCAEQGLLKVGMHWMSSPSADMRKFLLEKPKTEWPEMVGICHLTYQVSRVHPASTQYRSKVTCVIAMCVAAVRIGSYILTNSRTNGSTGKERSREYT